MRLDFKDEILLYHENFRKFWKGPRVHLGLHSSGSIVQRKFQVYQVSRPGLHPHSGVEVYCLSFGIFIRRLHFNGRDWLWTGAFLLWRTSMCARVDFASRSFRRGFIQLDCYRNGEAVRTKQLDRWMPEGRREWTDLKTLINLCFCLKAFSASQTKQGYHLNNT